MFTNPTTANLADFYMWCIGQGVPVTELTSGTLTGLIVTPGSGYASATATSGTVAAGMVLAGNSVPSGLYITNWSGLAGTVSPAVAVNAASAQSFDQFSAWALNYALEVAIPGPQLGPGMTGFAGSYVMSVYNLGLHQLLKIAPDSQTMFFSNARQQYGLTSLRPGVVMASEDQGTSQSLVVPEFFHGLTLSDLDLIKTPYGREYLGYAQMYGANIVGCS